MTHIDRIELAIVHLEMDLANATRTLARLKQAICDERAAVKLASEQHLRVKGRDFGQPGAIPLCPHCRAPRPCPCVPLPLEGA
jgi:hypothetical protein